MKKSVALLVSSLSIFALCSDAEGAPKKHCLVPAYQPAANPPTSAITPYSTPAPTQHTIDISSILERVEQALEIKKTDPARATQMFHDITEEFFASQSPRVQEAFHDLERAFLCIYKIKVIFKSPEIQSSCDEALKSVYKRFQKIVAEEILRAQQEKEKYQKAAEETHRKLEETRKNCDLLIQDLHKLFIRDGSLDKTFSKRSLFQFISSIGDDKYTQGLKGAQASCTSTIDHIRKLYAEIHKQSYSSPTISIKNAQQDIENILDSCKKYPSGVRTKNQVIVVTAETIRELQTICEYLKTILMP